MKDASSYGVLQGEGLTTPAISGKDKVGAALIIVSAAELAFLLLLHHERFEGRCDISSSSLCSSWFPR